jgi:hypothetical protein
MLAMSTPARQPGAQRSARAGTWAAALVLWGAFLLQAVPMWALDVQRGRSWFDQHHYHWPTIVKFAREWPAPDVSDYLSATTPQFHLVLARVVGLVGERELLVQMIASLFTLAMLGVAGLVLAREARRADGEAATGWGGWACLLGLPLACSTYVAHPGVWLGPDNAGWLWVLVLLGAGLVWIDPGRRGRSVLGAAAMLFVAALLLWMTVQTRQSHLWAWALVMAAAWIGAAPLGDAGVRALMSSPLRRLVALALALLAGVPAVWQLAWYVRLWDGLVPPAFQAQHGGGPNWSTPALALALLGVYSLLLLGWVAGGLGDLWRTRRWVLVVAAAAGALAALLPPTTHLAEPRSSGLWNLALLDARLGLIIADRTSPSVLVLSIIGAVCLAGWLVRLTPAQRWYTLGALVAFEAAQTANANAWQRYQEPMLLVLVALWALMSQAPRVPGRAELRWSRLVGALRVVGPVFLCVLLLAVSVRAVVWPEEAGRGPGRVQATP